MSNIAEPRVPTTPNRVFWLAFAASVAIGALAAGHYAQAGLTLSHYDARAHLVVARRIIDSLTPGWRQLGAVWLPLPQVLNAVPVQWDWAFKTGAVAVACAIGFLSWGLGSLACYLRRTTGSVVVALVAPAIILLNPSVLYLQSTPMTEPMLIGLALVALDAVDRHASGATNGSFAGWVLAALVMTRYEGWLICAALLTAATVAGARQGVRLAPAVWQRPAAAVVAFLVLSRASTGSWFVSSDFFVADSGLWHNLDNVLAHLQQGTFELVSPAIVWVAVVGVLLAILQARRAPEQLLPLSFICALGLPLIAFYEGHPYRVRYLVPMVLASATLAGVAVGAMPRRVRAAAALLLLAVAVWSRPPLDPRSPMVVEAQRESPQRLAREHITRELSRIHDGQPILASMGSLGHYMQEAARGGFALEDFLHEGNGDLWLEALKSPRRSVRWMLIEEQAEGGDVLARRAREDATFLGGFERVSASGGLALYRRR